MDNKNKTLISIYERIGALGEILTKVSWPSLGLRAIC